MSYCRWSDDDFRCDLYCYEDASGGWTTHVAGRRHVGECPHVAWTDLAERPDKFWADWHAQETWLDTCEHADIGLPHDGETFNDPTLEDFRERLLMLRASGYRFPDYVITGVEEEIAEATT